MHLQVAGICIGWFFATVAPASVNRFVRAPAAAVANAFFPDYCEVADWGEDEVQLRRKKRAVFSVQRGTDDFGIGCCYLKKQRG